MAGPALVAFVGVACVLAIALGRARRLLPVDRPNERSLHVAPVPRMGGMAMMAVVVPVALAWVPGALWWVAPTALLAVVSGVDDVRGLPVRVRLAVQAAAAAWAVWAVWAIAPGPAWVGVIAWLATVWMTNLYNFMDGSDGLAGGMAVAGFGTYALAAWLAGDPALATACLVVAAAAAAFLMFNFNPARVFMGDAGSVPLGFLAAAFGLAGWRAGHWSALFPVLAFAPFVADATVTLARRGLRGERVWEAHRTHYYQRLIQLGTGHRRTALLEYALMAIAGTAAIWGARSGRTVEAAVLVAIPLVAVGIAIDRRWARRSPAG
jgi:UDP-N-acetylmuramyl pentapeptide phosphotransferase/UDP-N-acetylglucosamine-1-phosphate transferase